MALLLVSGIAEQLSETDAPLAKILHQIQPFIQVAERRQLNDESVQMWLSALTETIHDIQGVLDKTNTPILMKESRLSNKVPSSVLRPYFCFNQHSRLGQRRRDRTLRMKSAGERLSAIAEFARRYLNLYADLNERPLSSTTLYKEPESIYGRDEERNMLISKLLNESRTQSTHSLVFDACEVISVVGMVGIGKTTLVRQVFDDLKVRTHFDLKIWVHVGAYFDISKIFTTIIRDSTHSSIHMDGLNSRDLRDQVSRYAMGKKILLVLDDVNADLFELRCCLRGSAGGSKILVTASSSKLDTLLEWTASELTLGALSEDDCWLIFSRIAFDGWRTDEQTQLEEIGRRIVKKCYGLPLAVATLGGIMRSKRREQWEDILHSEIWEREVLQKHIFPTLKLNYDNLSPPIRHCFLYCAVLPKDSVIDRDLLIKLWMSQGYLDHSHRYSDKESLGRGYFMELASWSFFLEFEKDYKGSIIRSSRWKIPGLLHDLAIFLARHEFFIREYDPDTEYMRPIMEKVRHCTFVLPAGASFSNSSRSGEALPTLFRSCPTDLHSLFLSCSTNTRINPGVLMHLTCLRTLNLSSCWFKELPDEIGKFRHLKFLNLSGNDELERLPKTLCDLHNLQSLLINDCIRLQRLPEEIGNLVNLRHLLIDWSLNIERLPKGIAKLTSLHTLDMLVLPRHGGEESFQLADLESLNNLEGSLRICRCGNLETITDAGKAGLMKRYRLVNLTLDFDRSEERTLEDTKILEALLPHQDLQSLEIRKYRGSTFSPDWMMWFTNLKSLVLYSCQYCQTLPPLGKLPSLQSLDISLMKSVEIVGLDFLGIGTDVAESSTFISFPELTELRFSSLVKWKVWEGSHYNSISVMPSLHFLEIHSCRNIQVLPDFLKVAPVQKLTITKCELLQEHYRMGTGKEWAKISHIPTINIVIENSDRHDSSVLKEIDERGESSEDIKEITFL